jgi:hypothetical protein
MVGVLVGDRVSAEGVVVRRVLVVLAVVVGLLGMLGADVAGASRGEPVARAAAVCADYDTQREAQEAVDTIGADGDGILGDGDAVADTP